MNPDHLPGPALHAQRDRKLDEIAATCRPAGDTAAVIVQLHGDQVQFGHDRGAESFYPASVVKLFWLAYEAQLHHERARPRSSELNRALDDMIRASGNEATQFVVDATTGTTGGEELDGDLWHAYVERREAIDRWLESQGFENVVACQKTYHEGPYGREREFGRGRRNRCSALDAAAMMTLIALGRIVTPAACAEMLDRLHRPDPDDRQRKLYVGSAFAEWQIWSKAGWMSEVRHDVALLESPLSERWVIAVFTRGFGDDEAVIPSAAAKIARKLL